jgi:hypothetical protein
METCNRNCFLGPGSMMFGLEIRRKTCKNWITGTLLFFISVRLAYNKKVFSDTSEANC